MRLEIVFLIVFMAVVCSCRQRKGFCKRVKSCEVFQGPTFHSGPGHNIINAPTGQKVESTEARILALETELRRLKRKFKSMRDLEAKLLTLESRLENMTQTNALSQVTTDATATTTTHRPTTYTQTGEYSDWYEAGNGYLYKLFSPPMTYAKAKLTCASHGSMIASVGIRNRNFTERILNAMQSVGWLWLGATDQEHEGVWKWEDGRVSSGSDINWSRGCYGECHRKLVNVVSWQKASYYHKREELQV